MALVLALVHELRVIIVDEPTSGLDPLMQDMLMMCLRELTSEGHTVMFSSHTLSEVETLCDRIAIVRGGRIVEDSTLSTLKAQAPRQIVVTLNEQQSATDIRWPQNLDVKYVPGASSEQLSSTVPLMVPPSLRSRTCILELVGTSAPFVQWAAEQCFADVVIGSPSLEVLFRRYYED